MNTCSFKYLHMSWQKLASGDTKWADRHTTIIYRLSTWHSGHLRPEYNRYIYSGETTPSQLSRENVSVRFWGVSKWHSSKWTDLTFKKYFTTTDTSLKYLFCVKCLVLLYITSLENNILHPTHIYDFSLVWIVLCFF